MKKVILIFFLTSLCFLNGCHFGETPEVDFDFIIDRSLVIVDNHSELAKDYDWSLISSDGAVVDDAFDREAVLVIPESGDYTIILTVTGFNGQETTIEKSFSATIPERLSISGLRITRLEAVDGDGVPISEDIFFFICGGNCTIPPNTIDAFHPSIYRVDNIAPEDIPLFLDRNNNPIPIGNLSQNMTVSARQYHVLPLSRLSHRGLAQFEIQIGELTKLDGPFGYYPDTIRVERESIDYEIHLKWE